MRAQRLGSQPSERLAGVHLRLGGWWTGWHESRGVTRQLSMSVLPPVGSAAPGRARRPEDDFALAINAVHDCLCPSGCFNVPATDTPSTGRAQLACSGGSSIQGTYGGLPAPLRVSVATHSQREGVHARRDLRSPSARAACMQDSPSAREACIPDGLFSAPHRCIGDSLSAREACLSTTHDPVRACKRSEGARSAPESGAAARRGCLQARVSARTAPPACAPEGGAPLYGVKRCAAPRLRPFMGWRGYIPPPNFHDRLTTPKEPR